MEWKTIGKIKVTRHFEFEACHRLPEYDGDCARFHGHTYKMEVTVEGAVDHETGMVIDFKHLNNIVKENIIQNVDHRDLTEVFPFRTTAENMVSFFAKTLLDSGLNVCQIKLWETTNSYATWEA